MFSNRKPHRILVSRASREKLEHLAMHYHVDPECIAESAIALMALVVFQPDGTPIPRLHGRRRGHAAPTPITQVIKGLFDAYSP